MKQFDIIIIGGGAVGTSALYHLTKGGLANCLLVEKKAGSGQGATGSWGSLIRVVHLNPETTKRAIKSVPFYLNFENEVGHSCNFNRTGSLYFLKEHELDSFSSQLFSLEESGLEFHLVRPDIGRKEFPDYYWYEDDVAIYEPSSGNACPTATTRAFLRYSTEKGAQTLFNSSVERILTEGRRVTGIETSTGEKYGCERLLLTAGIWTLNLLKQIETEVNIFPQTIQINRFCRQHKKSYVPLFIDRSTRTFGHFFPNGSFAGGYVFEDSEGNKQRKAVSHLSIRDANIAKQRISHRLNWIKNSTLEGGIRAIESYTRDYQGLIEYDAKYENLLVSAGWSCTGFTLAPLIGNRIAEKIL